MKKIFICIITSIMLLSCFEITALANKFGPSFSEDYQHLYIDTQVYSRFNASMIESDYTSYDIAPNLTDKQQEEIADIYVEANNSASLFYVEIEFKDGSHLSCYYLRDDYRLTYETLIADSNKPYIIDFEYPAQNTVSAPQSLFKTNPVTLDKDLLWTSDTYPVLMSIIENDTRVYKGSLLIIDESYYYVDFAEIGIKTWYEFSPYDYTQLSVYEITDGELISNIQKGEEAFYGDSFGFLYNDDFTESVSTIFLVVVFAVIPAVILILFLILAIRSKTLYRKLFTAICGCAGAELIIFAIVATMLY